MHCTYSITFDVFENEINIPSIGRLYLSGLLQCTTCDYLGIYGMELSEKETMILMESICFRVRDLELRCTISDLSFLANYDGQGRCERISFNVFSFDRQGVLEVFDPWFNSVGWSSRDDFPWIIFERIPSASVNCDSYSDSDNY